MDALSAGVDDALPVDWTSERAREVDAIMRLQSPAEIESWPPWAEP